MFCRISCWCHHPFSYNGPLTTPVKTLWKHPKNRERLPNRYVKWANNVVQEDMLNVPAIFLQCSIDQMFSMFHRKTFMVNLAKTFNKHGVCSSVEHATRRNWPNWLELTKWMESLKSYPNQSSNVIRKALRNHHPRQSAVSVRLDHFLPSYPKSGRASQLCLPSLNHFIIWYKISPFPTWFRHSKWRRIQTRSGLFLRPGWS